MKIKIHILDSKGGSVEKVSALMQALIDMDCEIEIYIDTTPQG